MNKKIQKVYSGISLSRPMTRVSLRNLGKLFVLKSRRDPEKPGRELVVAFDERVPLVKEFKVRHSYFVRFICDAGVAGNHYHYKKNEIFIPICGDFRVDLQNVKTQDKESLVLLSDAHHALYIPVGVAHRVQTDKAGAVLLVLATFHGDGEDEVRFQVFS